MTTRSIALIGGGPASGKTRLGTELAGVECAALPSIELLSIGNTVRSIGQRALASEHYRSLVEALNNEESRRQLPNPLIQDIVREQVQRSDADLLLLDGYPRYETQVEDYFELANGAQVTTSGLILIRASDQLAIERIMQRGTRPGESQITGEFAAQRVERHKSTYFPTLRKLQRQLPVYLVSTNRSKEETDRQGRSVLRAIARQAVASV